MHWHQYGLIASWEFLDDLMERKNTDSDDQETSEKVFVEKRRKKKKGVMVIIKSLQFLPNIINAALTETNHSDYESPLSGNIMHIAIVGINNQMSLLQDRYLMQPDVLSYLSLGAILSTISVNTAALFAFSENEDQTQERVNKLDKILKEEEVSWSLCSAGVGVVSCIIQRDEERTPVRHSFHWSMEKQYYTEEPMLRHLEPPLSIYLELV